MSATSDGVDAITITASRAGDQNAPVQDTVDFTVSAGGMLTQTRVKTDAAGLAVTRVTSSMAGPITVTASVPKISETMELSTSLTVTFTAPAARPRLRFQTSPVNTMPMNLLRPVPVVVVEDGAGVLNTASSASITVAITPGSCAASLDSTSLMTVTADRGAASFYGLKSSVTGTGCTLTATSGTLQPAVSTAFDLQ